MNFKENESVTKLRGGYYTPQEVARFLARWVLQKKPKTVLEPSCGDGIFIAAMVRHHRHPINFTGIEILSEEAEKARAVARGAGLLKANIVSGDFLAWALPKLDEPPLFDAVLGNPPYIRYQYLEEEAQARSEQVFSKYQLPFTKHTNAWVPFVIASVALLKPGGRLAMVIPAELLHVLHAASLRKYLLSECSRILIIDPNDLLFEEALQGTILLMAEKKSTETTSMGVSVVHAPSNMFLHEDPAIYFDRASYVNGDILNGKWMKLLLVSDEIQVFEKVRRIAGVHKFSELASVDVGIVTGANKFFLVNDATVKKYGLGPWAKPMFGRSEHCLGVVYDKRQHHENRKQGLPTNFLMFGDESFESLPSSVRCYLLEGEQQKIHTRYKCRIRTPWYKVPSVYATRVGMLKRSHHFPRLILNSAGAYTTDTAYRIQPFTVPPEKFVCWFLNSLTALTAELEGRHYGGGVLELVPSEIEKLLIPIPKGITADVADLDSKVRASGDADGLLCLQDEIVLKNIGLSKTERQIIHESWQRLRSRRHRTIHEHLENHAAINEA